MTSERERAGVTVTAETLGADGDGPDAIVVRVHGEEVGAYAIADDAEAERRHMARMVDAILVQGLVAGFARGRDEGAEAMRERAAAPLATCLVSLRTERAGLHGSSERAGQLDECIAVVIECMRQVAALLLPTDTSEENGQ